VAAVNNQFYPQFRTVLSIKEIEDPAAKELFIALEECFINDEFGMDDLLSRIPNQALRNFVTERSNQPMFRENSEQLIADGVRRIKQKRLKEQLNEIVKKIKIAKNGMVHNPEGDYLMKTRLEELLAEKMHIDIELRQLKEVKE
jgi:DNA primase